MYDAQEYFALNGEPVDVFSSWVRAAVTLFNPAETLETDANGFTFPKRLTSMDPSLPANLTTLRIKTIVSCDCFSEESGLAALENPFGTPLAAPDKAGMHQGDIVYNVIIPDIMKLHGYESTRHSKSAQDWVSFSPADCATVGVRQPKRKANSNVVHPAPA
jgi:hypothetical protein